jgi:NADPH-dependent 2,4-dienoyl-CoA reductase/sulfur reductase-like enzyme/nitrite reductase/ring-hydroxylating ferredoxin subunit
MTSPKKPCGPDLTAGIAKDEFADRIGILGHVGQANVLLVRSDGEFFAIEPTCSHYHGPLVDGLVTGGTIRCPWHHACFDLRTGEALRAPALDPLRRWKVSVRGELVLVDARQEPVPGFRTTGPLPDHRASMVIVGGGAAGLSAADMLRRQGFDGRIVMFSSDDVPPVDRPNLSKDYLAGTVSEDDTYLRPFAFYSDNAIDLRLNTEVTALDTRAHEIAVSTGERIAYDRLLLATGAEPVRLWIPGADGSNVLSLRSLANCRKIIEGAEAHNKAVIIGASFIGLEVAAALRARGVEVHVVAPERVPMERVLGREMGRFLQSLHEEHGVTFHLNDTAVSIAGRQVLLKSGRALDAGLVIAGIGVRPRIDLAVKAGLLVDRGVVVNSYLETSAPDVFAAGDIARWPDLLTGCSIRVEHWVVAERQGQTAALNMLGRRTAFAAVPYFWSQHYDVPINYVGHAEKWDEIAIEGDIAARDCTLRFKLEGRTQAIASIFRDHESLQEELSMEKQASRRRILAGASYLRA